ncbi:MAG: hypothetical protein A4E58_03056 [Syntrophorhabdus sp. PtaB.Bin006]|nr:MAG: hypothetical protein A4E58_03056 [Syntrophorhabdus sp. PtaB.Bin006]
MGVVRGAGIDKNSSRRNSVRLFVVQQPANTRGPRVNQCAAVQFFACVIATEIIQIVANDFIIHKNEVCAPVSNSIFDSGDEYLRKFVSIMRRCEIALIASREDFRLRRLDEGLVRQHMNG